MKKLSIFLIIIAICMISINTMAQDIIIKKDGTDIQAKILEVTTSEVKYKRPLAECKSLIADLYYRIHYRLLVDCLD